jgi:molybdopterin-containing oxidoreductase family iron-sulfur binding subunit
MEKCTFCVQRIYEGQERAKAEGRPVQDGEIVPACAQACPTDAIIFGDLSDPESRVSKAARNQRRYTLLEELGTEPKVTYLKGEGTYGG